MPVSHMPYCHGEELAATYATAHKNGYGFFASNVVQFDIMVGLLRGALDADADLVSQVSRDTCAFYGDGNTSAGLRAFGSYIENLAESKNLNVFLNVDHVHLPDQRSFLNDVVASGVPSSVMVDASDRPFEENIEHTREAVEAVRDGPEKMLVEAELGRVAGEESGVDTSPDEAFYTDPDDAVQFVEETGVNLLAVSVGTQHGVASGRDLDVRPDVADEVNTALHEAGYDVPLVVHGSSGVADEQVEEFLDAGVCKFNKNTRYQYEFARTAADFYRDHTDAIRPPKETVADRASFFADSEWSPDKTYFHPHVVAEEIRDRLAEVMVDLTELTGCAGRSRIADVHDDE
jgi:ketose-bisphosphate aldolase